MVAQSNPLALPLKNPKDGKKFGDVFRRHLGCKGQDFSCLKNASVASIITAQDLTNKHFFATDPLLMFCEKIVFYFVFCVFDACL